MRKKSEKKNKNVSDILVSERISEIVQAENLRIEIFDEIDSTNAEARRQAEKGESTPALLIAKAQSAGRGRMGRSFLSRANSGIFMSLLYFTEKPLSDAVSVTTAAAVIVAEEIEATSRKEMLIKWVNDVYNKDGKVCGILAETLPVSVGDKNYFAMIVGIGINVGEIDFPEELRGIASSIGEVGDGDNVIVANIVKRLVAHSLSPDLSGYIESYRKRSMLQGKRVVLLQNGEAKGYGTVKGIDDDGGLILLPDGEEATVTVRSGEVSVRINE